MRLVDRKYQNSAENSTFRSSARNSATREKLWTLVICSRHTTFTRESNYCFQHVLAIAILSVRLSVTPVDQSKAVQARITKSSPSAT